MSAKSQREYIETLRKKPIKPEAHGNISTYTNHGCRCTRCRLANSEYMKQYRLRIRQAVN